MKAFAALLRLHLRGRGALLASCLFLGLLPFLLPLLPAAHGQSAAEVRTAATPLVAGLALLLLALFLGSDLLSRDFAERRLSFFLARPIATAALFWARYLALLATLAGAACLLLGPAALAGNLELLAGANVTLVTFAIVGSLLLLPLLASTLAIAIRARSRLLPLDLAAVAGALVLATVAARRLSRDQANGPLTAGLGGLALVTLGALIAGHLAALAEGRSDLGAARAALGRRLWTVLVPATLLLVGYSGWTLAAEPSSLESIAAARPSPTGDWLAIAGPLRGRLGFGEQFLWHPATGRSIRIGSGSPEAGFTSRIAFSADGTSAAWIEPDGADWALWRLDLARAARGLETPRRTGISFATPPTDLTLSPRGEYLAARTIGRFLLYRVADGRLIDSGDDTGYVTGLRWPSGDRLRVFSLRDLDGPQARAVVWELGQGANRALLDLTLSGPADLRPDFDGERALVRDQSGWRMIAVQPGTPAAPVAIVSGPGSAVRGHLRPLFLADGRILVRRREADGIGLALLDRRGATLRDLDVGDTAPGAPRRLWVSGTPDRDHLWLVVSSDTADGASRLIELDLRTGAAAVLARGVLPADLRGLDGFELPIVFGRAARWLVDTDDQLRYLRPDGVLLRPFAGDQAGILAADGAQ